MREIVTHRVNGVNERLTIRVGDETTSGGASVHYYIELPPDGGAPVHIYNLTFQNGPPAEVGTNGITQEALLAIVIDRLQSFQRGPFACRENALALTKIEEAVHWLNHRTRARATRGVEGTLEP